MKILCSYIGGSHLYGLETPESDKDERFVFLNTEPKYILGLEKYENLVTQNKIQDKTGKELRHFLHLLKKGNTESIEALFNNNFIEISLEFLELQKYKTNLINPASLFKSLMGYIYGEKKVISGITTCRLGEKRKSAIEKYGFCNRNVVHALRLLFCGIEFFKTGFYPVNIKKYKWDYWNFLFGIKTKPEQYNLEELNHIIDIKIKELKTAYDYISVDTLKYCFNYEFANEFLRKVYLPFLK